ncbi:uncharacterized protein E5676_scaffold718G00190 [Cucumis melo var. makuwa]|uniref:Retrotransposon gag domain-containing protein n=1 Tax=Cucumis melo var. makuwa TaxID=1194695 RepID=A0A5A7SGR7_CUCMM|nr:uncharacterized protein E6C27_scaffold1204G00210 [Cucumis melo var. makuwa]TYK06461.1 uncharacterized protein E5676_scaffold718G00190 [Cucumis melo var. makuwa]
MSLIQGDMTIVEYEKRFTELAKYALALVIDETDKYERFQNGLRTKIRASITACINSCKVVNIRIRICVIRQAFYCKEISKLVVMFHLNPEGVMEEDLRVEIKEKERTKNVPQRRQAAGSS